MILVELPGFELVQTQDIIQEYLIVLEVFVRGEWLKNRTMYNSKMMTCCYRVLVVW
jgi:hypothetical protein